ncbi:major facilitator superfamily domain-containing protein [Diaporthe sp. PMI_573]|nr:major facilitator superfamily domain-containing protein [Diaporthaceae sp. PMI_573]
MTSPLVEQSSSPGGQGELKAIECVAIDESNAGSSPPTSPASVPYSIFTKWQKLYLTYLLGFLTLASSLTANIYLPLILLLAEQYHTSAQAINLTITVYVIFQGISASFWSPLSDVFGRRPVFILTFGLYTAASLGLALSQGSYTALIILRATQSVGGSAVLSLAYGVVADLVTSAERGSMLGPMLASGNLGPCIGPIIGGGVVMTGQPAWCFWALVIFGGIALMLILWTMPETRRTIVGNGSVPALGIWRTWWSLMVDWRRNRRLKGEGDSEKGSRVPTSAEDPNKNATGKGRLVVPNPFISLRLVFYRDTFLGLWLAASPYAVWYLIQASIPVIYGKDPGGYGFKDIYVGLCYLTGGSGVIAGGFICGKMMDRNYKHVAKKAGFSTNKSDNHDIHDFPIEEARSRFSLLILAFSACVLVGFAWAVQLKVHPAVPLILQFYLGAKCTVLHQVYSALVVDIFPEKPSTIAASNNIIRCGLSAAVVAALNPLVSAMGRGWFFTMVAFLDGGLCIIFVVILRRWGKQWRNKRSQSV